MQTYSQQPNWHVKYIGNGAAVSDAYMRFTHKLAATGNPISATINVNVSLSAEHLNQLNIDNGRRYGVMYGHGFKAV